MKKLIYLLASIFILTSGLTLADNIQFECSDTTPCGYVAPCEVLEGSIPRADSDCDGVPDFCVVYSDGVTARKDNCVCSPNSQLDSDGDHVGDACDVCPDLYNPSQNPADCETGTTSEVCGNGLDDDYDGLVDYCDSDCECLGGVQLGCSVCGVCKVPNTVVNDGSYATITFDIISPSNGFCTINFDRNSQDKVSNDCVDFTSQHIYPGPGTYNPFISTNYKGTVFEASCPEITVLEADDKKEVCGNKIDDDNIRL